MIHLISSSLLAIFGCVGSKPSPDTPAPPPAPITLSTSVSGTAVEVRVGDAPAGSRLVLLMGESESTGPCPAVLGGACLGITSEGGLRTLATGVVGVDGSWSTRLPIPPPTTNRARFLQAVIRADPAMLSEVAAVRLGLACGDAWEPNDRPEDASAPQGAWSADACGSDDDWYVLDLPIDGLLDVTLTYDTYDGDVDVELLDDAGRLLDGSYQLTGEERVDHVNLTGAPERLRLHVWDVSDPQADGVAYAAAPHVAVPRACVDDATDADDEPSAATSIQAGAPVSATVCPGDDDWYAIELDASEYLQVEASGAPGEGRLTVEIYDAAGRPVPNTYGPTAGFVAEAPTTALVRVTLDADDDLGGGAAYDLTSSARPVTACAPDALEPDDAPEEATLVGPGVWDALTVCQGHDWYAVDAIAGQTLDLWFQYDPDDGELAGQLFTPGGQLAVFTMMSDGLVVLHTRATQSGRYLAHIADSYDQPYPTVGGVAYAMMVSIGAAP